MLSLVGDGGEGGDANVNVPVTPAQGSSGLVEDTVSVKAIKDILASPSENWWGELLLLAVRPALRDAVSAGDNVVLLFPEKTDDTCTVLMCDQSKPSPYRWSYISMYRAHFCA
jgi:hypothetical protein